MVAISMSEIAVVTFVNEYGSNATAAYGIVNQIASYVQIPEMSISIAISVFVAQSVGAGQTAQLKQITKIGVGLNYLYGGILIIIVCLFADPSLSVFLKDQQTMEMAKSLILLSFWSYALLGHIQAISATKRATGTVLYPTLCTILSIWLIQVPTAYILSHFTDLGIKGVWLAYSIAFFVNLSAQILYYQVFWKKKKLKAMVQ